MLLDQDFINGLSSLSDLSRTQTLDFVKKTVRGILYANVTVSGRTVTGQLKKGDGVPHEVQGDLVVRSVAMEVAPLAFTPPDIVIPVAQVEGALTVTTGTSSAGGRLASHIRTTSSGGFAFTVGGTGPVAVEVLVNGGVASIVLIP